MPKIKKQQEEIEEDEEEEFEDEELEEEDIEKPVRKTPIKKPSKKQQPEVQRRFGVMPSQPVRIADAETNEVIGEGEYLVPLALADIIERLERIENTIGSITEG